MRTRRAQLLGGVLWALALAGCQNVTGLNKLQADRTDNAAGAEAVGGKPAMRRDAVGANGGTRAASGTGGRDGTGGRAGVMAEKKPAPAGSGGTQSVDPDADAGMGECVTRITYGSAWIRSANHVDAWDEASGLVTWDGSCQIDAAGNSFAQLSNGWRPFFTGRNSCVIALDAHGSCAPTTGCSTRLSYGASWLHPEDHTEAFDDVAGVVTTNAHCYADGEQSFLQLSNGWQPHFMGKDGCSISVRYSQCKGLFANPLVETDCPDPSVLQDGDQYVMTCTSESPELPLHSSRDLVHWKLEGSIFTQASKPQWADRAFWSPEIHRVGDQYLAYFSARHTDGVLAVGVASSSRALGPYRDSGAPLLRDSQGAIDPHQFEAPDGTRYVLWKVVGNLHGNPATIQIQPLAADGLSLTGSASTLLTNSEPWEGTNIHAPWLRYLDGYYYLFYDAEDTTSDGTAIAVARAMSVTGPYTKATTPSVVSVGEWLAPGMGAAVRARDDNWFLVFHASPKARDGAAAPGRQALLTRIVWADGWPSMLAAPSALSQPVP